MKSSESFSRQWRLRSAEDFSALYRRGKRLRHGPFSALYQAVAGRKQTCFGIAIARRYGGSVVRNRVRRVLREVLRRRKSEIPEGLDLVWEVGLGAKELSLADLRSQAEGFWTWLAARLAVMR